MLFSGLGSLRILKNCDLELGLENAALGLRSRTAFSRPRSQFFLTATNINLFCGRVLTCSTIAPVYFTANAPAITIPPNITADREQNVT